MQVSQRLDTLLPLGSQSGTSGPSFYFKGSSPTRLWEFQGPLEMKAKDTADREEWVYS